MMRLTTVFVATVLFCSAVAFAQTSDAADSLSGISLPKQYILDNDQKDFTCSSDWALGTAAADKYGSDYRYRATGYVSDPASWSITVTDPGMYDIFAWWSQGTNRTPSAAFILPNGTTCYVNMQVNGGRWNLLGTIYLSAGTHTTTLSSWAPTGYIVIADAVKYVGPKTITATE